MSFLASFHLFPMLFVILVRQTVLFGSQQGRPPIVLMFTTLEVTMSPSRQVESTSKKAGPRSPRTRCCGRRCMSSLQGFVGHFHSEPSSLTLTQLLLSPSTHSSNQLLRKQQHQQVSRGQRTSNCFKVKSELEV